MSDRSKKMKEQKNWNIRAIDCRPDKHLGDWRTKNEATKPKNLKLHKKSDTLEMAKGGEYQITKTQHTKILNFSKTYHLIFLGESLSFHPELQQQTHETKNVAECRISKMCP